MASRADCRSAIICVLMELRLSGRLRVIVAMCSVVSSNNVSKVIANASDSRSEFNTECTLRLRSGQAEEEHIGQGEEGGVKPPLLMSVAGTYAVGEGEGLG